MLKMQDQIDLTNVKNDELLNLILYADTQLAQHLPASPKKQHQYETLSPLEHSEPQPQEHLQHFFTFNQSMLNSFIDQAQMGQFPNQSSQDLNNRIIPTSEDKRVFLGQQKNSNSIKKMGRIILDHLLDYFPNGKINPPIDQMMKLLNHCKHGERLTDYKRRDRFNTIHLSQMFKTTDPELQLFNLQTTRKLLGKWMRSEIMRSKQIEGHSKIVYLNSLKCSAIRCANPTLAVRLQMSL